MITRLFGHATIGDGFAALETIREPDINLAVARDVVSPGITAYLSSIDWHGPGFTSLWEEAPPPPDRGGICNKDCRNCPIAEPSEFRVSIMPADLGEFDPDADDALDTIRAGLHRFPPGLGAELFANNILDASRAYADAVKADRVRVYFDAKYDQSRSTWHRDGGLEERGLITYLGSPTFWRPNHTVPEKDWDQDMKNERGQPSNSFGQFGKTFMEQAQQVERGHMMIFKGANATHRPLIHAAPTHQVTGDVRRNIRLLMTIDKADPRTP